MLPHGSHCVALEQHLYGVRAAPEEETGGEAVCGCG